MKLCDYGCNRVANFQFKNGKYCCEDNISKCPAIISKIKYSRMGELNPNYGRSMSQKERSKRSRYMKEKRADPNSSYNTTQFKEKQRKSMIKTRNTEEWKSKAKNWMRNAWKENRIGNEEWKTKQKISQKITINKIKRKYHFFSKIEEMRYNPNKPKEKEIQVHCKNHNCPNSKEQGGWFTPTYYQLYERIRQLEKDYGNGGCYFYCCDKCKEECPLYNLKSDPLKDENKKVYTQDEYNQFREFVLERDNYRCQYCGKLAEHVHHERPQKLEPFFALDPDLAWSVCRKCHYKKGHKEECSTGKLAAKPC
jgi:5-methylcytosine-specific restriction endonuclease McrA